MELQFVGVGSAFNTKLGNNSAYIKENNELFLIDCGSANFDRILRMNLLAGVKRIYVLITHLHPDHIGSLGDLIFYSYYAMQPIMEVKIAIDAPAEIFGTLKNILGMMGVDDTTYVDHWVSYENPVLNMQISSVPVIHDPHLSCFGYLLVTDHQTIYYSGDANMIPEDILSLLMNDELERMYQDTCSLDYNGNAHLSLKKLTALIPREYRHKVWCMHLDPGFDIHVAKELGFNVVNGTNLL